jgi:uncharacterized protein YbbC (DUF1343 family)/CubicO group peptidase (beta-lactamase class C family)
MKWLDEVRSFCRRAAVVGVGICFLFTLCVRSPGLAGEPPEPPAAAAVFHAEKLAEMDAAILQAIADKKCPGGVLWLERQGTVYCKAYGRRAVVPAEEPMTEDTIFDVASLTKAVATTPAIMLLVERGQVSLDAPVCAYLPEFKGDGKEAITVKHLLTHTSGLRPGLDHQPAWSGYDTAIKLACAEKLRAKPGETLVYSDINFEVLGEVVRRVSRQGLDQFLAKEVYQPLKMADTGFRPPASLRGRIAPTEQRAEEGLLRGVVHDPTARSMGGVAGHAGLFTTAADLARFARMMLGNGELDGVRIFKPETVKLMTSAQTPDHILGRRGLGWDIDSGYSGQRGSIFPLGGYGHTGWTGTSLWIDPFSQTFLIFLSNRNHPDEQGNVLALRRVLGTLAAQAVIGFNFSYVPDSLPAQTNLAASLRPPASGLQPVLNGIDVLAKQDFAPLKGLRIGLITNHTGHDRQRNSTIDLLMRASGVTLKALFSPEHGIRGALDERVKDGVDERTGLPIYSLYGASHRPRPEQLRDLDALVFDVQDVGCRFYTYITTMGWCMEAAAQARLKYFVLDRVNPIGGAAIEGPVLEGEPGFVGFHTIPLRYGLTIGELARLYNAERKLKCDLTVVPLEGWSREAWFDQTGLPWTNPSPNLRNLAEATFYPGVGLLESAVSVGRGTGTPFEVVGAPYVDDVQLAAELRRAGLAGVGFVPIRFTPEASTFKGQPCGGVYLVLTDRDSFNAVDLGLTLALTLRRLYPEDFALDKTSGLLRHPPTLAAIRAGKPLAEIKQSWEAGLADFKKRRAEYLLYP